jgi:hypothetical protein
MVDWRYYGRRMSMNARDAALVAGLRYGNEFEVEKARLTEPWHTRMTGRDGCTTQGNLRITYCTIQHSHTRVDYATLLRDWQTATSNQGPARMAWKLV